MVSRLFFVAEFRQKCDRRSSGGKSKQFTDSNSSFIMTWYPGKLNSLTFNGRDGESFKTWLLNVLISKRVKRTDTDGGCLHALAETSVKSKQHTWLVLVK